MILFISLGTSELIMLSIILFIPLILMAWALVDVLVSNFKDGTVKLLWVIVILFVPLFGWILYFLIGRNQKVIQQ